MSADHPNRLPFHGVVALLDVPSDRALRGARGHPVLLTRQAAIDALPTLLGMAVNCRPEYDDHLPQRKCGIITAAHVRGNRLKVTGFIFAQDYPEIATIGDSTATDDESMGMSCELAAPHVDDLDSPVWTISRVTFTGAAILLRDKAAYRGSSFRVGQRCHQGISKSRTLVTRPSRG